jgi:zinc D-Ala-D-Ala carboxypeptidase
MYLECCTNGYSMTRLSEHFTLEELCFSEIATRLGIDNNPDSETVNNLTRLCEHTLEPLRQLLDKPLTVSSGYRCIELNRLLKSRDDSQHVLGQAVDCTVKGITVEELFRFAAKNVPFDQAIQEMDQWLHISYRVPCRGQTLRMTRDNLGTHYYPSWVTK